MKLYKNEEWLKEQYVEKRRHINDIGEQCGAAGRTVAYWTQKFDLTRRRYGSYNVDDSFFECINTEEKAYWLGFIAADGCVMNSPGKRLLTICLAVKDRDHLENFRLCIKSDRKIHTRKDGNVQFDVCSDKMVPDLIKHGIHPRKSKTLKAPNLSNDLVHHWIRGYFDGDGCVRMNRSSLYVEIVGTEDVMNFIREKTKLFVSVKERNGLYYLRLHGNGKGARLSAYLYKSAISFLHRKCAIFAQEV